MQAQEKQAEVNVILFQSLSCLQRQRSLRISHGLEDRTNGEYAISILVDRSQIDLTRSKMACCWTLRIGEVIDAGTIPVLAHTCIMIIIAIILIGEVIWDTFWMSLIS